MLLRGILGVYGKLSKTQRFWVPWYNVALNVAPEAQVLPEDHKFDKL